MTNWSRRAFVRTLGLGGVAATAVPEFVTARGREAFGRGPAPAAAQRELLATFLAAARSGDLAGLERMFAAESGYALLAWLSPRWPLSSGRLLRVTYCHLPVSGGMKRTR